MKLYKKLALIPLVFLVACSSDSSGPSGAEDNPSGGTEENGGNSSGSGAAPATGVSLPSTANIAVTRDLYSAWKKRWIVSITQEKAGGSTLDYSAFDAFPNALRVRWDSGDDRCLIPGLTSIDGETFTEAKNKSTGCTVSEGVGYGMLITLFNDDQTTFDGIWAYNKGARGFGGAGLMPWQLVSFYKTVSNVSALDADIDVATALILASYKWGKPEYMEDAKGIVAKIYELGINPTNLLTYPGPNWRSKDVYNLSYFSPVAFRLFAAVDGAHDWNAVLDAHYKYMMDIQAAGATKAVFPDWSNAAGAPVDPKNGSAARTYMMYFKESVRIPWRIAWDYYWYADERAKSILTNLGNFIASKANNDPNQMPQFAYNYTTGEASIYKTDEENYFGAACLSGFGVNTAWTDACTAAFNNLGMTTIGSFDGMYFRQILQMMFSTMLNGGFVKPNM